MVGRAWALFWLLIVSCVSVPAWAGPTTPIRSWSPASNATFRMATTCHDVTRDVYVIGAVFRFPDLYFGGTYDALYQIRVQGSSTGTGYGDFLGATYLTSSRRIDNVDCTTDDAGKVFLAFDRISQHAAWYRFDGTAVSGPFAIEKLGWCGPWIHRPRLAFAGGATPRLIVAYEGYTFGSGEHASCEACVHQIDPNTGVGLPATAQAVWNDNMTHSDYDIEWNGLHFILALPYKIDAGDPFGHFATYSYDLAGANVGSNHLQSFGPTPTPAWPEKVRLVYSRNTRNYWNRLFVQTDQGSYWLYPGGSLVPLARANPLGTRFAACEYWGADNGAAATFDPTSWFRYVFGVPFGYFVLEYGTARSHYGLSPAAPYETSSVNTGFYPEACDGANTYTDPEVMLVSTPSAGPNASVYWNLLAND